MEEMQSTRVIEPHKWMLIKLTEKGEVYFKVMGSWLGGYAYGDSWRLSSQVQSVEDAGNHWLARNHSGSVYILGKKNRGMSSYTASVYSGYEKQASESEDLSIEISTIEECIEFLKGEGNA